MTCLMQERIIPMYEKQGKIPAIEEIKFSITSNRGCFGGCNFCPLAFHQGPIVQTRSHGSIRKAKSYVTEKDFLKDIFMMWEDLQQIFAILPAKNRNEKGYANKQCLFRNLQKSGSRSIKIIWNFFENCGMYQG